MRTISSCLALVLTLAPWAAANRAARPSAGSPAGSPAAIGMPAIPSLSLDGAAALAPADLLPAGGVLQAPAADVSGLAPALSAVEAAQPPAHAAAAARASAVSPDAAVVLAPSPSPAEADGSRAPLTERIAAFGERIADVVSLGSIGDQVAGLIDIFDLGRRRPALAFAGAAGFDGRQGPDRPWILQMSASGRGQSRPEPAGPTRAVPLPEGGWKGTTAALAGRDVMSLLIKTDERTGVQYATLSEYTRNLYSEDMKGGPLKKLFVRALSALLGILPLPEILQITRWVPRMHAYRVEHIASGLYYALRPLRVSKDGYIEVDLDARPDILAMRGPGSLKGAMLVRYARDGKAVETISFKARSISTWEPFVPGQYFGSTDSTGGDYFHKRVNTTVHPDGVVEFDLPDLKGRYRMVEDVPGMAIFTFVPLAPGQLGAERLASMIGVFIDIVNWKPVAKTNELLLINPADPRDVGFFYQRGANDRGRR